MRLRALYVGMFFVIFLTLGGSAQARQVNLGLMVGGNMTSFKGNLVNPAGTVDVSGMGFSLASDLDFFLTRKIGFQLGVDYDKVHATGNGYSYSAGVLFFSAMPRLSLKLGSKAKLGLSIGLGYGEQQGYSGSLGGILIPKTMFAYATEARIYWPKGKQHAIFTAFRGFFPQAFGGTSYMNLMLGYDL